MMFMAKVKVLLVAVAVVLSVGAVLAGSASAAIEFKWKVGGTELKSGETKGFIGSRDGTAVISGVVAGAQIKLLSKKGDVATGAQIIGGVPGTGREIIELEDLIVDSESCSVSQNGVAGTVKTVPLTNEIVEGASNEKGNNEVDVLVTPTTGTTLATFEFTGSPCKLAGATAAVSGSFLGLALPQKTEVLKGAGDEEAITKEYKNSAGAFKKAGMSLGGEPVTIHGLVLVSLISDQIAGAF
jgi:hypothetical protein